MPTNTMNFVSKFPDFSSELFNMNILVVDDESGFLDIYETLLRLYGYKNVIATNDGRKAVEILEGDQKVDLVLTDVSMPALDGFGLLDYIKSNPYLSDIPVIMISGLSKMDNVISCIEKGAEDYLTKPVKQELLWARVNATLDRKYLRDHEFELHRQMEKEKEKSENILFNVMPRRIARRLRSNEENIADTVENASVVFADIVDFTSLADELKASKLVGFLNMVFLSLDHLVDEFRLEKIKTVGDSYMAAGGLSDSKSNHADQCVRFAEAAMEEIAAISAAANIKLKLRIGIASGPVIAGVIGRVRPMFDIWGKTVNIASRMESHGEPGKVQISKETFDLLSSKNGFEELKDVEIKGMGNMTTYMSKDV